MATKAAILRALRIEKRLTQEEVAGRLKVSQAYYSAIERGKKPTEIEAAMSLINKMRLRGDRTEGGQRKAGRQKG